MAEKARVTYWLYDRRNGRLLTAVRAWAGDPDAVIIGDAIRSHEAVPLCRPDYTPYQFTVALRHAEVRL